MRKTAFGSVFQCDLLHKGRAVNARLALLVAIGVLVTVAVLIHGFGSGPVLAVTDTRHCPPTAGEGGFVPNGNANGDPAPFRDQLLEDDVFPNARVQEWCVHGSGDGYFYALVVDGRFVAKCSWDYGSNKETVRTATPTPTATASPTPTAAATPTPTPTPTPTTTTTPTPTPTPKPAGNLTGTAWTSTDVDGPGHTGTHHTWQYTYDFATKTLTTTKFDKDGKVLKGPTSVTAPPFSDYSQLQGGSDPIQCSKDFAWGGIAELPDVAPLPGAQSSPSAPPYAALAGVVAAAALVALSTGAWYARRRWGR